MTQIRIKRVYEAPDAADGYRVLVDRLWPRGIKKEHLKSDVWEKDEIEQLFGGTGERSAVDCKRAFFVACDTLGKQLLITGQSSRALIAMKSHSSLSLIPGAD